MALALTPKQSTVVDAQYRIFNKLCIAYRRSHRDPIFRLRAEDVRKELALPQNVFVEAVDNFIDAIGIRIVLQFEQDGNKFITLGEIARSNISDENIPPTRLTDDRRGHLKSVIANRR